MAFVPRSKLGLALGYLVVRLLDFIRGEIVDACFVVLKPLLALVGLTYGFDEARAARR